MLLTDLDSAALLESLGSRLCPACGGNKAYKHTFCGGCYSRLSFNLQRALYRRLGNGYQEAVTNAMRALRRDEFRLPDEAPEPSQAPAAAATPLLFDPKPFATKGGLPA